MSDEVEYIVLIGSEIDAEIAKELYDNYPALANDECFVLDLNESEAIQAMHYYKRLKKENEILDKLARFVRDNESGDGN